MNDFMKYNFFPEFKQIFRNRAKKCRLDSQEVKLRNN